MKVIERKRLRGYKGCMGKKKPKPAPPPVSAQSWPELLTELRDFYGKNGVPLSQEEAAERMAAPLGTWRNYEQGRRKPNAMIIRLLRLTFPEYFRTKS